MRGLSQREGLGPHLVNYGNDGREIEGRAGNGIKRILGCIVTDIVLKSRSQVEVRGGSCTGAIQRIETDTVTRKNGIKSPLRQVPVLIMPATAQWSLSCDERGGFCGFPIVYGCRLMPQQHAGAAYFINDIVLNDGEPSRRWLGGVGRLLGISWGQRSVRGCDAVGDKTDVVHRCGERPTQNYKRTEARIYMYFDATKRISTRELGEERNPSEQRKCAEVQETLQRIRSTASRKDGGA
ncbi:hypothetical protein M501DRAFT_1044298 [Patellaria atrata CBS 101060]|uniref:Uncharacterized protein n=1 Tax=Patellaria atrata CBS 101060 TaxID=1346257 RepID=A0A9P4S2U6_9PEZI|nr:hypothetical protein M501DRAFT_1044298 [Patellaria atrata CBS 101060]